MKNSSLLENCLIDLSIINYSDISGSQLLVLILFDH